MVALTMSTIGLRRIYASVIREPRKCWIFRRLVMP